MLETGAAGTTRAGGTRTTGAPAGRGPVPPVDVLALPVTLVATERLRIWNVARSGGQDPEHVRRLADVDEGLPPILVHRSTLRVIDGNHRLRAAELCGRSHIAARFFDGDDTAAYLLSVTLNVGHGLPLSLADRKTAAARILQGHPDRSDRWIARQAGVAPRTVAKLRAGFPVADDDGAPTALPSRPVRIGRDGRARPVDRSSGRSAVVELLRRNPDASLRAVAAEVGVSPETVRDVRTRLRRGDDPVARRMAPVRRAEPPRTDRVGAVEVAATLRNDPTLRFSAQGRALLRLLDAHRFTDREWLGLSGAIPPHCRSIVAQAARECAAGWLRFAERLESTAADEGCC